ncbi:unnamed protein product [Pleuronectes platessa]|uniref:Tc1-like transposase DDE domain-containing protein n=1 Tax=Pleuronectes platessa TaxID=8262 RepID=A0A9N7VLA1_PLEPL|nr:unnamed protein product [Pleuronectes platessa]
MSVILLLTQKASGHPRKSSKRQDRLLKLIQLQDSDTTSAEVAQERQQAAKGVGSLTILPKSTAMNKEWYQNILREQLLPTIQEQSGDDQCLFQHDGAPCHKAKMTAEAILRLVNDPVLPFYPLDIALDVQNKLKVVMT